LTEIYVDGDACPVREEVYRVAARLQLNVLVVANGSRPIRPPAELQRNCSGIAGENCAGFTSPN
jgi:uncharacterized protein YaiI (UPF0178 family)